MSENLNRRDLLKRSVALSAGIGAFMSFEEMHLLAQAAQPAAAQPASDAPPGPMPMGKIGPLSVSRLICGGNLISTFAHARDLIYVSALLKQYFTDEKICDTLELCEEHGINTAIMRVDDHTLRVIKKYRGDRGGKIQWIAQVKPNEDDLLWDSRLALENTALGVYMHGGVADEWVQKGKVDLIGKFVEQARKLGAGVIGLGAHDIATTMACVKAGLEPDFFMKTLNAKNYWSAGIMPRHDSVWCEQPEETIAFMKTVQKPWVAFKVLGAGAIHPREGFKYAFANGADFCCVGMFDFQVVEDVLLAKKILAGNLQRERPWIA